MNGSLEGYFKSARGLRQGDPLSPYLFLIAMEFFSRLFNKMVEQSDFAYHPKCTNPHINHICFADDLFILCTPNDISFQIIHQALQEFHKYSGLMPNGNKSKVYISGINHQSKLHLCSMLGFQLGELPVKYLGVPLISTKLKHEDCKELIDKVTQKVQSWAAKYLSYAGRVVLIKSVLFSIQIYWSAHFIFPKEVCKAIEQILRRYLWTGADLKKWGSKISWAEVCKPKKEGGLGLRRLGEWNKATMMRHIWALCSRKPSLWVKWCHSNLLKGKCFWEIKPPSDCSWTWRNLLKLREEAIGLSYYKVGKGNSISLWYSNWHPLGPLIPRYGARLAYDAGLPKDAKVDRIVVQGTWKWPYPCTWELREIILEHPPSYYPDANLEDKFFWKASRSGAYTTAATWNAIREKGSKKPWHHLAWFPQHIPRHSFILWLAINGRLSTKERMLSWGMSIDPTCVLCGNAFETLDHLLFMCPFSAELRGTILCKCSIIKPLQPWNLEVSWAMGKFSGKQISHIICRIAWAGLVYHLWEERNSRIFKGQASSVATIEQRIMHVVRTKVSQSNVKLINVDSSLLDNWGIH